MQGCAGGWNPFDGCDFHGVLTEFRQLVYTLYYLQKGLKTAGIHL